MYLVDKKKKNRHRELSFREKDLLKYPENSIDTKREEFAQSLKSIKNHYWIECDCRPGNAYLVICSGKYKIVIQCKERSEHKTSCVFFLKSVTLFLSDKMLLPQKQLKKFDLYYQNEEWIQVVNASY